MKKVQMAEAVGIAKSDEELSGAHSGLAIFDGFGLPGFGTVFVTTKQVAILIRYQAHYFNGGWDEDAIREIWEFGRKRFMIV